MRKILLGCAAVLVATSAQAAYVVTLVDHATGLSSADQIGTFTIDVMLASDGLPGPSGSTGFTSASALLPSPAGWSIGDVTLDPTGGYDPVIPEDPRVIRYPDGSVRFSFTRDSGTAYMGPWPTCLARLTLLAPTPDTMMPQEVVVIDELFEEFTVGSGYVAVSGFTVTPEPGSILLLLGALALLARRRALTT